MIAQGLPSLGGALLGVFLTPSVSLVPISTISNAGWTASAGTAHAALAAAGGASVSASSNAASLRVRLG